MGRIRPRDFPADEVGTDVVNEEEQPDNTRDGSKPGAPRLPGNESFPKVDEATNPEKLARNQYHGDGKEEQEIEGTRLAPTGGQPESAKANQRESDQTLVSSEEPEHPCHIRAGRVQRLAHHRFPHKRSEERRVGKEC